MKHLNLALVCVGFVVCGAGLEAQAPAGVRPAAVLTTTMHLSVITSLNAADVAPGQRLALAFVVTPKKAMHVYAPGKHDYQVIAVKLDPQPWLKVLPTSYPPSEIYHFKELNEKVETYGKPFTLVQNLTVLATPEAKKAFAASPTAKVSGRLEYQACDETVCYAPTKVPFGFTVNVKELGRN